MPVIIRDLGPLEAELAEIDENLQRCELTPYEAGEHLNRREAILDAMGLRAQSSPGTNQYTNKVGEIISPTLTTSDLAEQIGLSERSAQQRKQIAKAIPKERWGRLPLELQGNLTQLLELARLDDDPTLAVALEDARCALVEASKESALAEGRVRVQQMEVRSLEAGLGDHLARWRAAWADARANDGKLAPIRRYLDARAARTVLKAQAGIALPGDPYPKPEPDGGSAMTRITYELR